MVLGGERLGRSALVGLLADITSADWALPSECPGYTVKGVATHILGGDLSLLSRQRDSAENGLLQISVELPEADFRTLLDTFNNRWILTARFLSSRLLVELLRLTGEWTAATTRGSIERQ